MRRGLIPLLALVVLGGAAGCATAPTDPVARQQFRANNDPFEPLNRKTFAFNEWADRVLIKPVAQGYVKLVPEGVRDSLRHFLDNLNEPIVLGNTLLQGRFRNAGTTTARFLVNSSVGLAGFRDVASHNHLPKQIGDFGQTFWAWGVPEGPYLILPLLGPSNPRDATGSGVDVYMDPFRYVARANHFGTSVTAGPGDPGWRRQALAQHRAPGRDAAGGDRLLRVLPEPVPPAPGGGADPGEPAGEAALAGLLRGSGPVGCAGPTG